MKKVYFLSDVHLGSRGIQHGRTQERRLVSFLDSIKDKASALYLLGDIFDFWYEFKTVVPKGYTRFLGKISELTDSGVEVHFFIGNHDIWCGDYFEKECGMWDLNYFKYCFLKATGLDFQEDRLEDDFQKMADVLMRSQSATFMYRDFQSRNVMIKDGEPYFIDFQGGRKGPFYYDVASFLWQAKARYPDSLRQELLKEYLLALRDYKPIDEKYFYSQLRHFVLFRTLQVLGAYGFRGYFEKKPHFIQSVPFAIENLRELLENDYTEYPYLCGVLKQLTEMKQFTDDLKKRQLTVRVMSFAYKKGIPEDTTGNGGGYVFDCRAVNNPGKYDRYKPFIGIDEPVIKFLEDDGEILVFLEHVYALVDASVKRYIERGFSNLQICFGCTGGRHRSVYSAQHLAEHLNKKFGVRVELVHREQNIEQMFKAAR
jgi:Predicted P-loop-containing kinase